MRILRLGDLASFEGFVKALGDENVLTQADTYTSGFRQRTMGAETEDEEMSLRAYLKLCEAGTKRMIAEHQIPERLRTMVGDPPYVTEENRKDLSGFLFCGPKGYVIEMHCDGDGRDVLLTQMLGRKRVVVGQARARSSYRTHVGRLLQFQSAGFCLVLA